MGFKPNSSTSTERWDLGLLFVFFPEHEDNKKKKLSSSSSFDTSSASTTTTTTNNLLFTKKAHSTISIFALMLFFTLLVFTISTFEPPALPTHSPSLSFPRRLNHVNSYNYKADKKKKSSALQGVGVLFRKGTKSMSDLIVAHLDEDTRIEDLRLFLRTLHRSSILTRSDVAFIFPSHSHSSTFSTTIHQENESFLKFISSNAKEKNSELTKKKPSGNREPLWGPRTHSNNTSSSNNSSMSWGSVVGFVSDELDPENSLSGFFLDHVPIQLGRWACYPMLLGRVRRNFKHVMLVDVKNVVVLGDALARVRSRSPESVYFYTIDNISPPQKHGRKNSEKTLSKPVVTLTSDVITGGIRGIRRLSEAMLNQIVRVAMQHKNPVSDSSVLSHLLQNEFLLKTMNIDLSISEWSLVTSSSSSLFSLSSYTTTTVVYRGNRNIDLNYILGKEICSSTLNSSSVYIDC